MTGVQTCALPIWSGYHRRGPPGRRWGTEPTHGRFPGRVTLTAEGPTRPNRPRTRPLTYAVAASLVAGTTWAAVKVGFDPSTFWKVWSNPLWEKFWPVPWDWVFDGRNVIRPLIETFQIAIVSTVIGCGLALPISFAMSSLTTPNRPTYLVSRAVMKIGRAHV